MGLDIEKEVTYLEKQKEYFKKQIIILEKELKEEDMIISTNNSKTLMANPKVKILNDYTKNLHMTYERIVKLKPAKEVMQQK